MTFENQVEIDHVVALCLLGVSEDNWKLKVKMSRITRHTGVDKFQLTSTVGARFEVELANLEKPMKRAVFLYEKGPSQYHIAHLLQYQLDRILGVRTNKYLFLLDDKFYFEPCLYVNVHLV